MANDGKIYITISDKRGGTGVGKEPETQQETQQVDRVKKWRGTSSKMQW